MTLLERIELLHGPIQAHPLGSTSVGRQWLGVIPQPSHGRTFKMPPRTLERLNLPGGELLSKAYRLSKSSKNFLRKLFTRDFGLKPKLVQVLLEHRTPKTLLRIFRQWESIIDMFILADVEGFQNQQLWRHVFRSYIGIASTSLDETTRYVKEFTSNVKWALSQDLKIFSGGVWSRGNPFVNVAKDLDERYSMNERETYLRFAHLISSRSLAPGGRSAEAKATKSFKEIVTSTHPKPSWYGDYETSMRRVVRICRNLYKPTNILGEHISTSNSGDRVYSSKDGGKSAALLESCETILNEIPLEDEILETSPLGPLFFYKGICRWQSIDLSADRSKSIEWMSDYPATIVDRPPPLYGANDYTGNCILYVAYREYLAAAKPYEVRLETVSEPGGKSRCITVADWWLPTLQQGPTHVFAELLGSHPSAHSCFKREDQAWNALRNLSKIGHEKINEGFAFLTSDFTSATDTVPFYLVESVVRIMLEETGLIKRYSFLLDLIGTRRVTRRQRRWVKGEPTAKTLSVDTYDSTRGIMMGEPLSKIVLVLSILALEEYTYSKHLNLRYDREYGTRDAAWRAFHIGGDDHLAYGPLAYLQSLALGAEEIGYIPSKGKHYLSRSAVPYTEKLLLLKGSRINYTQGEINNYPPDSVWIDSIKMRLISPFTTVVDSRDDRNIAIGKARALSRTAMYFRPNTYSERTYRLALNRFKIRFAGYVPSTHRPKLSAFVALPSELGGWGLCWNPSDATYVALPPIIWWALDSLAEQRSWTLSVRKALGGAFSNPSGYEDVKYLTEFAEQIRRYPGSVALSAKSTKEAFPELFNGNIRETSLLLREKGLIPFYEFEQLLGRPFKFLKLLNRAENRHITRFNTRTNKERFASLWGELEALKLEVDKETVLDGSRVVTLDLVRRAAKHARFDWFVDLTAASSIAVTTSQVSATLSGPDSDEKYFEAIENGLIVFKDDVPLREHILYNAPDLKIRPVNKLFSERSSGLNLISLLSSVITGQLPEEEKNSEN